MEVLIISIKELTINEDIREKEVRVIDTDGSQLGIMATAKAIELAYGKDLDLVIYKDIMFLSNSKSAQQS